MLNRQLSSTILPRLRCPACRGTLDVQQQQVTCTSLECGLVFPVVDGIPVLLNEATSVFSIGDFVAGHDTTFHLKQTVVERWFDRLLGALPEIGKTIETGPNYERFRDSLFKESNAPKVLVVGGSILGQGMQALASDSRIEFVSTDVSFGPLTSLICDAHDIPFEDDTFDGVIVQAVLEHVVDPHRCVHEVHRVLKNGGLVYAETPFMQQVHMGRYDFARYTHSGHRRLFRQFSEVASGPVAGPGMALAWSYQYFLLSFATSRMMRGLLRAFAQLTSFHLKYFDSILVGKRR